MTTKELKEAFPTEASLCDSFIESLRLVGGWTVYPETAGFDILAVYETGHQLGVEAKLALNAKVADQILPADHRWADEQGPDFRAVIVPSLTDASMGIARLLRALGVEVWAPERAWRLGDPAWSFHRAVGFSNGHGSNDRSEYDARDSRFYPTGFWFDWNPPKRCELPSIVPAVRAGVPAPLQLTPWKIGALKVLADLELDGFVTASSVAAHGINSRRFCATDGWLQKLGEGRWGRGTLPAFDQQHPDAYAQVLDEARAARAGKGI